MERTLKQRLYLTSRIVQLAHQYQQTKNEQVLVELEDMWATLDDTEHKSMVSILSRGYSDVLKMIDNPS